MLCHCGNVVYCRDLCRRCYRWAHEHGRLPPRPQRVLKNPCRHCQKCEITRARNLCWACSAAAEIRNLYPASRLRTDLRRHQDSTLDWSKCHECGGPIASSGQLTCDTCNRPPAAREAYHARIARYAERVAQGKPLFEAA
jgi:hypothetical protein